MRSIACGVLIVAGAVAGPLSAGTAGAWVETLQPWSLGERAGLRPGDLLLSWGRGAPLFAASLPAGGAIDSPFGLERAIREEAPRGALELSILRAGRSEAVVLPGGISLDSLGVRSRPGLRPETLKTLEAARWAAGRGESESAAELLSRAAAVAFTRREADVGLWLLRERVRELERALHFPAADAAFAETAQAFQLWGRPREAAEVLGDWAQSLDRRWRWDEALQRLERAERLLGAPGPWELTRARLLYDRGEVLRHRDDYAGAGIAHRAALSLRSSLAPASLDEAASLYGVGRVLGEGGGGSALPALVRAEEIVRRLDPGSRGHGFILSQLGTMLVGGDEEGAERADREALEIARRRDPGGYLEALTLSRLGALRRYRGDLIEAREMLRAAMALAASFSEEFLPLSLTVQTSRRLADLDVVLGDWEEGYRLARQAVAVQGRLHARSVPMAVALAALGRAAWLLERSEESEGCYRRALALLEELVPQHPSVPIYLLRLSSLAADAGRLEEAARLLARARPAFELRHARTRFFLELLRTEALVAGRSGRFEEAIARGRAALALADRLDLEGLDRIETLGALAHWERQAGRTRDSREHACLAASLVERQGETFDGDEEARRKLARGYAEYPALCAESLIEAGSVPEAFRVVEAGRARALLQVLALRETDLRQLPEKLRQERESLRRSRERTLARLEGLVAADQETGVEEARRELLENRAQRRDLEARTRRALGYRSDSAATPVSTLDEARRALDPGTVLLEYVVGETRALVFAVRPPGGGGPGVAVRTLAIGRRELQRLVEGYRGLLSDPLSDPRALAARSRQLYSLLVAPVDPLLARARRLAIVPDGPLHSLPFASLGMPDGRYLVERLPLHTTLSASVYSELRKRRRPGPEPASWRLAAFGEPVDGRAQGEPRPEGEVRVQPRPLDPQRRPPFAPLPQSRVEVETLRELFPGAQLYLGAAASERAARELSPDLDIVHFAVHAVLDPERPERSALVLSLPREAAAEDGDGFFESHEISAVLHLGATLVTLSACETALGKEMGGEGLVGVTRAFQLAGARSVLASLWAVADRPTARLMPRFYAALRAGRAKDEALRAAQLALLRDPVSAHPANWAGFVLLGDFR